MKIYNRSCGNGMEKRYCKMGWEQGPAENI